MKTKLCPQCGHELGYQHADDDVGISAGYVCPNCDYADDELPDEDDHD